MTKVPIGDKIPEKRLCKHGILNEYLDFTEEHEAPEDYHFWTCVGLIGSCLGRKVSFPRGDWCLYPNLYIILVGQSALARKSTSLSMGIKILRKVKGEGLNMLSQKLSPEYCIHYMAKIYDETKTTEAFIHASELSVLLGKSKLDDSFLKVLTDLYDCPDFWTYGTIARGQDVCNDVFLSILGGTTHEWLKNSLPEEALGGGFFSRLVLIHRDPTGRRVANPEDLYDLDMLTHRENIINDLKIVNAMRGPFQWSREAKIAWTDWYVNYNNPENAPIFMQGYFGRKGDMLIKLSMIISASQRDNRVIEKEDFIFAVKCMNQNESHFSVLISTLDMTKEGQNTDYIRSMIQRWHQKQKRPMPRSKLMQNARHKFDKAALDGILGTLMEEGTHEVKEILGDKGGRSYAWMAYHKNPNLLKDTGEKE